MLLQPDENIFDVESDIQNIFIGREQQLYLFELYLQQWKSLMRTSHSDGPVLITPSIHNKLQGFVVLIHGDGGLGKTSLLDRYVKIAKKVEHYLTAIIVDWEFVIGKNQSFLKVLIER